MIHQSIAGNYRKIMEPTNACIVKSANKIVSNKYKMHHYIVPQTEAEKKELWNYLTSCYIRREDPRTGQPMTKEQVHHVGKHFKLGLSKGLNQAKYIYLNEVETGTSLLEQPIC